MPTPFRLPAQTKPLTITFTPDEVTALADALTVALDHYTRKAEDRRRLSEIALTITTRRRAQGEALDLTAHARKLDAIRRNLAT